MNNKNNTLTGMCLSCNDYSRFGYVKDYIIPENNSKRNPAKVVLPIYKCQNCGIEMFKMTFIDYNKSQIDKNKKFNNVKKSDLANLLV